MKGDTHKRDIIFPKKLGMPCMYPSVAVTLTCEGYIKVIMYIKTRDQLNMQQFIT